MKKLIDATVVHEWINKRADIAFVKPFEEDKKGITPEWKMPEAEILLLTELKKFIIAIPQELNSATPNDAVKFAEWIAEKKYTLTNAPRGNGNYMWFITKDSIGRTTVELYEQFLRDKSHE